MGWGNLPEVWVWTAKWFGAVPDPSKDATRWVLVGQTPTRTGQPAGLAWADQTRRFQSPVLCFGFSYLCSHLDILLQIAQY